MTLQDLCEDLFLEICRLNRLARKGGGTGAEQGRDIAQIRAIFERMKAAASEDVGVLNQYLQVERPLVYFVDFMLSESKLPYASEWQWLEQEMFSELVGQTKFFELLDETLADPSPAAAERLEIFYKCIGLGFTGFYADQPEYLRRKMLEIQGRIKDRVELQSSAKIIPDGEVHVNTSNLYEPPGRTLLMMGIGLLGLLVVLFVGNYVLYETTKGDLEEDLRVLSAGSAAEETQD